MSKDNGGPAFPSNGSMGEVTHEGMTLRDYFAAKAMQGFLSAAEVWTASEISDASYELADAMLAARKEEQ